jgi:hypothetical protein
MITTFNKFDNDDNYIYHGTGRGQSLHIQNDGYMKTNNTGDEKPSISFTNDINYAKYYAKYKGGESKMVILRTKLNDKFKISDKVKNGKVKEYVTFDNLLSNELEILMPSGWHNLNNWNVIFDEPK